MAARQLQDSNKGAGLGTAPVVYRLFVLTDRVRCDVGEHVLATLRRGTVLMNELAATSCAESLAATPPGGSATQQRTVNIMSRAMPVGMNNLHVYPSLQQYLQPFTGGC